MATKEFKPKLAPEHCRFRLKVRESKIHRWGVFADEAIPPRRRIMEYTGEMISRRETKRRADGQELIYLFTVDSYWCKDGSVGGSGAEFINHCCEPNVEARVVDRRIYYHSLREIAAGEELTIDYCFAKDVEKHVCQCGARNCRGTINLLK